ncbi:uncharacterized protein LOC115633421 [Scaptodrosophila lebanonensis]|uniref:Uncharacterized protein LOC115633421 n=1 Tax=Drosophila lebanonensis TaxID=7225 RepID=A0A6J2UEF7_DROLE|nr:uncharacterized protein LOC115633421 [Scaptodrosophila lebanonensis]
MKWFSVFLVFGVLALIGSLGTLANAEPEPKGRPHTTRRPRNENDESRR